MDAPEVTLGGITATLAPPSPLFCYELSHVGGRYLTSTPVLEDGEPVIGEDGEPVIEYDYNEPLSVQGALAAAALAQSWPNERTWPVKHQRPPHWSPGMDPSKYGHPIFDALMLSGVEVADLLEHGRAARTWVMHHIIREEEVVAAEGFTTAVPEA